MSIKSESTVNVEVGSDLIKPIIEAKIHSAIAEALHGREAIIEAVVSKAMRIKVDSDGKIGRGYSGDKPYIEWLCTDMIQKSAQDAMKKWADDNSEALQNEFIKQLSTKKQRSKIVSAVLEMLSSSFTKGYFKPNIHFEKISD